MDWEYCLSPSDILSFELALFESGTLFKDSCFECLVLRLCCCFKVCGDFRKRSLPKGSRS